jgi:hypothetical protein
MPSRITPIPDTITPVPNYGTLSIYQMEASRYWIARVWQNNRYYKQSTKQEDKRKAIQIARDFYDSLRNIKTDANLIQTAKGSKDFAKVCTSLLAEDQKKVDQGKRNARLVKDQQLIMDGSLIPFFGKYALKEINYNRISEYINSMDVSTGTIKWRLSVLSKILNHAVNKEMLDTVPKFPEVESEDNPREYFKDAEYVLLRKTLAEVAKEEPIVSGHPITDELRWLVTFSVNSYLRPQDMYQLKVKHCEARERDGEHYMHILKQTKTSKTKPYLSMPAAVAIFEEIISHQKSKGYGKPDDFVFFPHISNRMAVRDLIADQFNYVLNEAGLKEGSNGKARTLYCLRHTALMMRVHNSENFDVFLLATAANTSVEMLERFYLKGFNAEQHIGKLNSMKVKKAK